MVDAAVSKAASLGSVGSNPTLGIESMEDREKRVQRLIDGLDSILMAYDYGLICPDEMVHSIISQCEEYLEEKHE